MELFPCRARRRISHGLKRKPLGLIKRLRKAKKEAGPLEKPEVSVDLETIIQSYINKRVGTNNTNRISSNTHATTFGEKVFL